MGTTIQAKEEIIRQTAQAVESPYLEGRAWLLVGHRAHPEAFS